jgi:hypothetical protein
LKRVCVVINEGVTTAGIDDMIKENGRVSLHLPPNNSGLNPTELVCGDIRNSTASTNLKEMLMFAKTYLLNTRKKNNKTAAPT